MPSPFPFPFLGTLVSRVVARYMDLTGSVIESLSSFTERTPFLKKLCLDDVTSLTAIDVSALRSLAMLSCERATRVATLSLPGATWGIGPGCFQEVAMLIPSLPSLSLSPPSPFFGSFILCLLSLFPPSPNQSPRALVGCQTRWRSSLCLAACPWKPFQRLGWCASVSAGAAPSVASRSSR